MKSIYLIIIANTALSGCYTNQHMLYKYNELQSINSIHPGAHGEVRYCATVLGWQIEKRRSESIQLIKEQCDPKQYKIIAEGPADVYGAEFSNIPLTASCVSGKAIYFQCEQ